MKLRESVIFLLLAMVLYSDNLGVYSTSPSTRNQLDDELSTLESSTKSKQPSDIVHSEKSTVTSSIYSNASSGQSVLHVARQLTGEDGTSTSSNDGNNTIRQVTDQAHEAVVETREQNSRETESSDEDISRELREETGLPDLHIRQLKDQLIRANIYLSLPGTRSNAQFIRELRVRVKNVLKVLGDATKDSELPGNASEKLKAMEKTLHKGKQIHENCAAVIKKLRAMLHLAEEQLKVNKKQTTFLTHVTAMTIPKGLHCLPLRLSTEYFELNSSQQNLPNKEKLDNPNLHHYALFSDNVLAAAVVVNSTITHAADPSKHVFHIVTDRFNYAAMRMWFLAYPPRKATIQVQNVEEFTWLNSNYSPILKQLGASSVIDYFFMSRRAESDSTLKYRSPKYLSILNHLWFYLPDIFPKLQKLLFLEDDIVIQKDLTGLWSVDLKGKVIGVVETCGKNFHRFDHYLNFSNPLISNKFSPHACGWAFGMNIIDLNAWRKQSITQMFHKWQNLNHDRLLWKLGTLPPGLITFWNHTYSLNKSWHVLGLGYNPNVPQRDIERSAVIHYNGNLKPWLEIAIPKFRHYWTRYVDYDQLHLRECNITP